MTETTPPPDPTGPPRTGNRRTRRRAVAAGLVVVALAGAAIVATRDEGDQGAAGPGGGTPTSERDGGDRAERDPSAGEAVDEAATSTTTPSGATTTTSAAGTTTAPTPSTTVPRTPPVPAPPPDLPGFSDEDPTEAPATPVGPQGPVAPTPCASSGPPVIASSLTDGPSSEGKRWVTVGHLEGNCGGVSGAFATSGTDTRIVVRSDADQFLAFLDDTADPGSNGGYADVVCRSRCSDQGILTIPAGTYVLRVQATDGPWVADVQEYR